MGKPRSVHSLFADESVEQIVLARKEVNEPPLSDREVGKLWYRFYHQSWAAARTPEQKAAKRRQQLKHKAAELKDPERGPRRRALQTTRHRERMETDPGYRTRKAEIARDRQRYWRSTATTEQLKLYSLRARLLRYGLTEADYRGMVERQGGKCLICQQKERRGYKESTRDLSIDHCHATGKVRGLLCGDCNTILGLAKDSPTLLRLAASYLERYTPPVDQ